MLNISAAAALPRVSGVCSPRGLTQPHTADAVDVEDSRVRGRTAARDACQAAAVQDSQRDLAATATAPSASHGKNPP